MKVILVSANRAEINMRVIPFGMACVASALRNAGHDVRVLDLMSAADPFKLLEKTIAEFQPELIGVSIRNIDDQDSRGPKFLLDDDRKIIQACKRLSAAPIVLGGAGFSIFPQAALEYSGADMGIQGEGEAPMLMLINRLQKQKPLQGIPGLFFKGKGAPAPGIFTKELDQFSLPGPDLILPESFNPEDFWLPVQTRRGCPRNCAYCSTAAIQGRTVRKRSPEKVVQWMAEMAKKGIRKFYFVDSTFNMPTAYAKELCRKLQVAKLGIQWRCILYPYKVDEPLVSAMAKAGCVETSVGFESGCERILRTYNKKFSQADIRKTFQLLRKYKIRAMGFLLLGGPGETRESAKESLEFADSLDLDALKITIGIRIYPNTWLALRACEEKIISADDNLLHPRFYIASGLEDWLRQTVSEWKKTRPNWM